MMQSITCVVELVVWSQWLTKCKLHI